MRALSIIRIQNRNLIFHLSLFQFIDLNCIDLHQIDPKMWSRRCAIISDWWGKLQKIIVLYSFLVFYSFIELFAASTFSVHQWKKTLISNQWNFWSMLKWSKVSQSNHFWKHGCFMECFIVNKINEVLECFLGYLGIGCIYKYIRNELDCKLPKLSSNLR